MALGSTLSVPDTLGDLLESFLRLPEDAARRFVRACYWYNLGRAVYAHSYSGSYLTVAFDRFLDEFAGTDPDRKRFYGLRSDLAHGSRLLEYDAMMELRRSGRARSEGSRLVG